MKILSKWKDYYDYVVGLYGMDPTLIYDRRKMPLIKHKKNTSNDVVLHQFHIINNVYSVFEYKRKFYHSKKELILLNALLKKDREERLSVWYNNSIYYTTKLSRYEWRFDVDRVYNSYNHSSKLNIKLREPVIYEKNQINYIPLLKSFKFHKVIEAEELYKKIETFLSWLKDNPPLPDTQTNKGKIVSHGFDLKHSFRPKIKK